MNPGRDKCSNGGQPVTPGKFTAVAAADESGPYSGTEQGPRFPGDDFRMNAPPGLTFPTDLAGKTLVITAEPDPDDYAAPFGLKPLLATAPGPAMDRVTYDMNNDAAGLPTVMADVKWHPAPRARSRCRATSAIVYGEAVITGQDGAARSLPRRKGESGDAPLRTLTHSRVHLPASSLSSRPSSRSAPARPACWWPKKRSSGGGR
jgi:hypothetical protein